MTVPCAHLPNGVKKRRASLTLAGGLTPHATSIVDTVEKDSDEPTNPDRCRQPNHRDTPPTVSKLTRMLASTPLAITIRGPIRRDAQRLMVGHGNLLASLIT